MIHGWEQEFHAFVAVLNECLSLMAYILFTDSMPRSALAVPGAARTQQNKGGLVVSGIGGVTFITVNTKKCVASAITGKSYQVVQKGHLSVGRAWGWSPH